MDEDVETQVVRREVEELERRKKEEEECKRRMEMERALEEERREEKERLSRVEKNLEELKKLMLETMMDRKKDKGESDNEENDCAKASDRKNAWKKSKLAIFHTSLTHSL